MSRRQWQLARTLRVLVACLSLWLPARTVAASLGPTDVIVMMAAARPVAPWAPTSREARADNGETRRVSRPARRLLRPTGTAKAPGLPIDDFPSRETPPRAVTRRLYLRHCALLC